MLKPEFELTRLAPTVALDAMLAVKILPSRKMLLLPVKSVIARFPAPSEFPVPAERMFQVWPPALVLASVIHVPKLLALPSARGVQPFAFAGAPIPTAPIKELLEDSCGTFVVS